MRSFRNGIKVFTVIAAFFFLTAYHTTCNDSSDWDEVKDKEDNCVGVFNTAQQDEDGDGIGDPCDTDTPYHDYTFGTCYKTNWEGLSGSPGWWDDIAFTLWPTEQGHFDGRFIWPDPWVDTIETGVGQENGRDIWFMGRDVRVEYDYWFSTFVEGTAVSENAEGVVDFIEGIFVMLECPMCGDPLYGEYWEYWWAKTWTGELTDPSYCEYEEE